LERNSEILKAIRRGEWSEQRIRDFLSEKESSLEEFYHKSTLPGVGYAESDRGDKCFPVAGAGCHEERD
ncbi:MAG: hypothetical protein WC477_07715, partial [Patescibacteria group bacterium]